MSRQRSEAEARSVQIRFRVTPTTSERLKQITREGETDSDTLRRLIETEWESQQ